MSYYVVIDIEIHNEEPYHAGYGRKMPQLVQSKGGVYLARGSDITVYEGDWHPRRIAIQRWPDKPTRDAFRESPEYLAIKPHRLANATTRVIGIQGLD